MQKNKNQKMDKVRVVEVGLALAAVAAGAYFFLGPNGKKHQKKMKGWMVRMKGEVLEKLEDVKDVSKPIYDEIVDSVAMANELAGKIPREDIQELANDLKKHWSSIKKVVSGDTKKVKHVVSKTRAAAKIRKSPKSKK